MSKEDLSKKRAAAKGKLTRAINRLTPSLKKLGAEAQMCEAEVHEGIETFVELYNNFKAAHEAVYRFVENVLGPLTSATLAPHSLLEVWQCE